MNRLSDEQWHIAQTACTPGQLIVLDYWRHGYGYKRISLTIGLGLDATRDRIRRGIHAINTAQDRERTAA